MKPNDFHIPIRVAGLSDGIHEFEVEARPEDIGLPAEFPDPLRIAVHMDKTHAMVVLQMRVRCEATVACDRCLSPLRIPVDASCTLVYAHDVDQVLRRGDDEIRHLLPDVPFVDVGDDVRDLALLSLPMRRVCDEIGGGNPECASILKIREHSDDDIDPRWDQLKGLREQ